MSTGITEGRWNVGEDQFAARIIVPDVKGFFLKLPIVGEVGGERQLIIEPGTRALLIDDGVVLGEATAGAFTMESLEERLQFWKGKQFTAIITRAEDVAVGCSAKNALALDGTPCNVTFEVAIQMKDVASFLNNYMGAKDLIRLLDLQQSFQPMFSQAARETIGSLSTDEIATPAFSQVLTDGVRTRVDVKLQRYGLGIAGLQMLGQQSAADKLLQLKGKQLLQAREEQVAKAIADDRYENLKQNLEAAPERIRIRSAVRDALAEEKLAAINSSEDFKTELQAIDRKRLLRKEEHDELLEAFEDRKEDRAGLREHLIATLDLQREQELATLQSELDHAAKIKSLENEIELSRLADNQQNEQWRAELEKDKERAAHRHSQRKLAAEAKWQQIREGRRQKRDESWEAILHEQKMDDVRADLETSRLERQRKVQLLDAELKTRLSEEKLATEKRQKEWELEFKQKKSANQLERLQKVQEMNARFAEQQQRLALDLENLKADNAHKRDIERMQAMGNLSTEAMIATAGTENASLLADLKKHEATENTAKLQATNSADATLNEERLRMYEKMNETEKSKADAVAEAFKLAMQSQQTNISTMIGGLAQAASSGPGAQQVPPPSPPPPSVWHISLNGTQSPAMSFEQVQEAIQSGQVSPDTMVWKTGMREWQTAMNVKELKAFFGPPSPPPGPPGPPPA